MIKNYKGISIGAGAAKGYFLLGALHSLYTKFPEKIKNITHFAGTSVGFIISTLLVIGYTPIEAFSYVCTFDFEQTIMKNIDFNKAIQSWGAIPSEKIRTYLTAMVQSKLNELYPSFNKIPTFKELFDLNGKMLIGVTYTLQPIHSVIYMNHIDTPDLNIIEACLRTSAIPFLFEK